MARRIPAQTVTVVRDGKRFQPPHGKPFEFTADEIEHFEKHAPGALKRVVVTEDDHEEIEQADEPQNSLQVIQTEEPPAPTVKKGAAAKAPKAPKAPKKSVDSEIDGL